MLHLHMKHLMNISKEFKGYQVVKYTSHTIGRKVNTHQSSMGLVYGNHAYKKCNKLLESSTYYSCGIEIFPFYHYFKTFV